MAIDTDTFTGFRPEAIQFLADLAENNDRDWFTPRKAEYERLLKEPLEALCVALDERVPGARHPARGRPDPLAVPDLPRCPVLQGQVPVQDERRGLVPVDGRRRRGWPARVRRGRQPGRLLPPVARARCTSAAGCGTRRRPSSRPSAPPSPTTRSASAASSTIPVQGDLRGDLRRQADTGAAGLPEGPSRGRAAEAEGPDVRAPAGRRRCVLAAAPGPDRGLFEAAVPGHALARRLTRSDASQPRRNPSDRGVRRYNRTTLTAPDRGRPHPGRRSPEGSCPMTQTAPPPPTVPTAPPSATSTPGAADGPRATRRCATCSAARARAWPR